MVTIREKFTELTSEYGEIRSYSGRGMFGKQTIGITLERSFVDEFKSLCLQADIKVSTDSMGLNQIVYVSNPEELDVEAKRTKEEILEEYLEKIENQLYDEDYTRSDIVDGVGNLLDELRLELGI